MCLSVARIARAILDCVIQWGGADMRIALLGAFALSWCFASAPALANDGDCKVNSQQQRTSEIIGGILGGLAGRALDNAGVPAGYFVRNSMTQLLTNGIACLLDDDEQKKAAGATNGVVNGGVGTKQTWRSETRPGVSGSSEVTGESTGGGGQTCKRVRDVIIVDGEERTEEKLMCKRPGEGYVLAS